MDLRDRKYDRPLKYITFFNGILFLINCYMILRGYHPTISGSEKVFVLIVNGLITVAPYLLARYRENLDIIRFSESNGYSPFSCLAILMLSYTAALYAVPAMFLTLLKECGLI